MPWLPLVNDFKQGLFYASLMVFWLVFAGEHLLNDDGPGKLLLNFIKYINLITDNSPPPTSVSSKDDLDLPNIVVFLI